MPISLPIHGGGFILRKCVREDASFLGEIEFDLEVKQYLAIPKVPKPEWIENVRKIGISGFVIQMQDGRIAGRCSIRRGNRKGDKELSVVLAKQFWGSGLGVRVTKLLVQQAFEALSARALVAIVHPDNNASLRLVRYLGFRKRGVFTGQSWQAGHYIYRLPRKAYFGRK
jgi:RimJ/RimL family protein N-acetyltransferase